MAAADDANRPELTSYILGELDRDETTRLEIAVCQDSTLRADVEELRTISDLISRAMGSKQAFEFRTEQRAEVIAASLRRPVSGQPAPQPRIIYQIRETAAEANLWDRVELLVFFLVLLLLGDFVRRSPAWIKIARLRLADRLGAGSGEGEGTTTGFEDTLAEFFHLGDFSEAFFKAAIVSAALAIGAYAWVRVARFPDKQAPAWLALSAAALFVGCLLGLLRVMG